MVVANASRFFNRLLVSVFRNESQQFDYDNHYQQPDPWETWGIGLSLITVSAIAAPIGILLVPLFNKAFYDRCMTFLVALGIGALSGSTFFILIPEAYHIKNTETFDYIEESWTILIALYAFFLVDRILQYVIQLRQCSMVSSRWPIENCPSVEHYPSLNPSKPVTTYPKSIQSITNTTASTISLDSSETPGIVYMIIFGSAANNLVDGMSMGAAFSDSLVDGLGIGIAVVSQQFPQELGTLAILVNSGLGIRRTLLLNLIPIFLSYIGFIMGVLLDRVNESTDTFIFAISSGLYCYIFLGTLIPEIRAAANEQIKQALSESILTTILQSLGIFTGLMFMFLMSVYGDEIVD